MIAIIVLRRADVWKKLVFDFSLKTNPALFVCIW